MTLLDGGCPATCSPPSGLTGLVHQRHHDAVAYHGRINAGAEGAGHSLGPILVLDHHMRAQIGALADKVGLSAEHHNNLAASAVEQRVGEYFHQGPAPEREQRLGAATQPCSGACSEEHARGGAVPVSVISSRYARGSMRSLAPWVSFQEIYQYRL